MLSSVLLEEYMVSVVMLTIGQARQPVAVLSSASSFMGWKTWFRQSAVVAGDEIVAEGSSYLVVKTHSGSVLQYDFTQTLLDPHLG
jgi:hypothetical protein